MSSSASLNLSNYTTVWSDNFANDTQLNSSLWPISWGNSDDFSFANGALTLTSYASEGWAAVGFMQADFGATSGQGYGLYSATFSLNAGEGVGICIVMWPANNVWPGPEIDLAEDWSDPTRQTGNATIHWAGAGNTNQYQTYQFSANMTQPTHVAMDWEPGSLTFYVNGVEVFQYTGPNVPKGAAQGGVNESFGAEVTAAGGAPVSNSVSLHLYSMSYATYNGSTSSSGGSGGTTPPGTGGSGGAGTGGAGGSTITLSAPGTVQQASAGAGATVTETVSAPGLSTIYEAVFTSSNVAEGNWQAVSLNAGGQGSFSATFQNSGDYIVAVNNPSNPTIKGWSAPITLTTAASGTGGSGGTTPPGTGGGGGAGAAEVTVADGTGRIVSLPLAAGTQTFAPSTTQLSGPVTETTANGVTDVSTPSGSGVVGLDIQDGAGGSYQADGFATVQATLSGASDGSLSVNDAQNSYVTLGSGNYTVRVASLISSATVQATAGSGSDRMTFIGSGTASFVCGSGSDTIVGGQGGNSITFGTGSADVWGGTGADTYTFHAGDGMQTIETFDAAKGDVLNIDTALKASLQETGSGGSTLLSLGGSGHGILLQGVASFDTSQIHWI